MKVGTHYGRPNWVNEFTDIKLRHRGSDVGVFFCGPQSLSKALHRMCNEFTGSGTRFIYAEERF